MNPCLSLLSSDLSAGWKRLYRLWGYSLEKKIELSNILIKKALSESANPVVCWSGGKDSSVVLHLVLQYRPNIPVIYVSSGVDFEESKQYINEIANNWNLNLHIAKPKNGYDFWKIGNEYGWPIFGKNIASNVGRAVRTGNIRKQLSKLEKLLAKEKLFISNKCSELLQEKPSKEMESQLDCDLKFVGLRTAESRARVRLWVDHGDLYYVKRYYGRGRGIYKANPIAIWTDDDVWKYHKLNTIKNCILYDIGYPRNGCWCCAMAVRNGQLKRLRTFHPKLFNTLILESEMGNILLEAKNLLLKFQNKNPIKRRNLSEILRKRNDLFDNF